MCVLKLPIYLLTYFVYRPPYFSSGVCAARRYGGVAVVVVVGCANVGGRHRVRLRQLWQENIILLPQ